MRLVHPSVYKKQHERGRRQRRRRVFLSSFMAFLVIAYCGIATQVKASYTSYTYDISIGRQLVNLPWPGVGSASVGYTGSGLVLGQYNGSASLPSASTIKVVTALVLLNAKPLNGEGDLIAFDATDEAAFTQMQAAGGAAVRIPEGTSIAYKRALEIMLIASANNIADKLAVWGFGSMDAYITAATVYLADNDLGNTVVADASGLSPDTRTSSNDLLKLGMLALSDPTLKQIVSTESLPLADGQVINNTNQLLGAEGFTGLKTGFTDEAGACLISTKVIKVGNESIQIVIAVMGQQDRATAYAVTQSIAEKFIAGFAERSMLAKGQMVGDYISPWGTKTPIRVREAVQVVSYEGLSVSGVSTVEKVIGPTKAGSKVGVFRVNNSEVELELTEDLPSPTFTWRLRHVVDYIREKV